MVCSGFLEGALRRKGPAPTLNASIPPKLNKFGKLLNKQLAKIFVLTEVQELRVPPRMVDLLTQPTFETQFCTGSAWSILLSCCDGKPFFKNQFEHINV
jgi:hypothetical protein